MRSVYPNLWRVVNLTHVLFLASHWFAAFYYMISRAENYVGGWSYPPPVDAYASVWRKYLKSMYWATLTLTTIGDLPSPESNIEYVFTIGSYLIGVFVFAAIVGQVGSVIANKNAARVEFERLLDGAKTYMHENKVPTGLQHRVQRWYNYALSRGRINGGGDVKSLGLLPDKLKTELALHVNLETLKKVKIFQNCETEFLHDVVLKMQAFILTPGDLVCRKGEVARDMFIISEGTLELQWVSGDYFGEIGILNISGGVNRRIADVRSVGYSELLVLLRTDVLDALKDYPTAELNIKEMCTATIKSAA
ncbi:Cyclic nucleotide-gated channel cone photoreceptor subunit alpha [Lamellibrachia satsuma]|nr:Cyclic nucleotide-gated channel cone photoreceptor subunit alpha [Lamellibrachia satsuma]